MQHTHNTLSENIRAKSVELLNKHLAAAIDLHGQVKQAHWNVRGPAFIAVHEQVKDSPDVDTDLPVSRQIEAQVHDHFGWDPYWGAAFLPMSSASATPSVAPLYELESNPHDLARVDAQSNEDDPHLCSIATIIGCHIHASDGEVGHVEDFLVDDAGWNIRYIKVDTRNWWPGARVLIWPYSVREIDWLGRLVYVNVSRQKIKNAPPYNPSITIDGAYEEKFLTYYGIRWVEG